VRARDKLLEAIAREQALIARLERDRDDAQARVRSLQEELNPPAGGAEHAAAPPRSQPPGTAAEKVGLFRNNLFRGREDVFPKLWVNPRTARKGYVVRLRGRVGRRLGRRRHRLALVAHPPARRHRSRRLPGAVSRVAALRTGRRGWSARARAAHTARRGSGTPPRRSGHLRTSCGSTAT